ncbi:MAG TPA: FlgO family outer membrane protein [Blastocatellia bacterium]|nr:FlgO family outer membrane protein [Blastocatellia bacterium]
MSNQINRLYEFGEFRINVSQRMLERQGKEIPLQPKVFDLLLALVERRGRVVSKDELMNEIWPDTFVEETNLKVNISALRKVLGNGSQEEKLIETLHKRGYRFTAEVSEIFLPVVSPKPPGLAELQELHPELPDLRELIVEKHSFSKVVVEEEDQEEIAPLPGTSLPLLSPATEKRHGISPRLAVAVGCLLLVAMALGWAAWRHRQQSGPHIESLAVLPFAMLDHGQDDEHLGLGLADALITRLTNSGNLIVRPTSAIQKFTAANRDPVEIGRQLKVDAVLDGHLQRNGRQVRLTVQLLNTQDGAALWAETIEEQEGNAFALQRSASERLGTWLTRKLSPDQKQQPRKEYTTNAAAFEAYAHGRYFQSKQTGESFEKALAYYRQAIELDPAYALAWAGIADCYYAMSATILSLSAKSKNNFFLEARAAAERAVGLDESLAEAHLALGTALTEKDYPAALRELERTLELNPNHAQAHNVYSVMVLGLGEFKKAVEHAAKARNLDPLSVSINTNLGMALFCDHRYDEAAAHLRKALELDANLPRARYFLGAVLGLQRHDEQAIAELKKAIELSNGGLVPTCSLAYVYAVAGRHAEARELVTRMLAEADAKPIPLVYLAMVYAALGDKEQALSCLEKIKGQTLINVARADPRFDLIRHDPKFTSLLSN